MNKNTITVQTTINAPLSKIWNYWNQPDHITQWAFASDDWEAPAAENDLCVGGSFKTRMASKDGKDSFDFAGTYAHCSFNSGFQSTSDQSDNNYVIRQDY